jgi:hypothetical protein
MGWDAGRRCGGLAVAVAAAVWSCGGGEEGERFNRQGLVCPVQSFFSWADPPAQNS